MSVPTMMVGDDSLDEIEQSISTIGDRIGRADQAQGVLEHLRSRIGSVRDRVAVAPMRRVLMLVGHQPIVAVGKGTYLDDLLRMSRADNIADRAGEQWPKLSIEYIIAMRPDVILDGQMGSDASSPSRF